MFVSRFLLLLSYYFTYYRYIIVYLYYCLMFVINNCIGKHCIGWRILSPATDIEQETFSSRNKNTRDIDIEGACISFSFQSVEHGLVWNTLIRCVTLGRHYNVTPSEVLFPKRSVSGGIVFCSTVVSQGKPHISAGTLWHSAARSPHSVTLCHPSFRNSVRSSDTPQQATLAETFSLSLSLSLYLSISLSLSLFLTFYLYRFTALSSCLHPLRFQVSAKHLCFHRS